MTGNSSGFTLIEFMVAILILMVGLLGMLQGINVAISYNLDTVLRNGAISVADEQMMNERSKVFSSIASIPKVTKQINIRGIFKNYSVQQNVFTRTSSATTRSKEIVVDVAWKYKNKKNTHSVSTVVSKSQ